MDAFDTPPPGPSTSDHAFPAHQAARCGSIKDLDSRVTQCGACPRLVAWRERVAATRRAAFRDQEYWGKPVSGFGPPDAALAIVGLAPAAHGGNRTGRMFTGDPSGDILITALHELGLASQPTSTDPDDGLQLRGVRLSAPVHCAPPDNKPTPEERDTCRPWLSAELDLLRPSLRAVVVLGGFGWQALLPVLAAAGWQLPRPRPAFGHAVHVALPDTGRGRQLDVLGCFHPSQRNTSTGRLTFQMLVDVLDRGARLAGLSGGLRR